MRNLFDQYHQPENRLTHALACCLDADETLMRSFLQFAGGSTVLGGSTLQIVEQQLPGAPPSAEADAVEGSLPDAWIYADGEGALLIESKVQSRIELGQLRRHLAMADRRGFPGAQLLVLSIESPRSLPERCSHRYWKDVYCWAIQEARTSRWAGRFAEFMEITEGRMLADGYLTEGTLTAFSGIHFDTKNPYAYREAKRLLKLLLDELRTRSSLVETLGMNPTGTGRGAITGAAADSVWDFLRLKAATESASFTKCPHLTVSIQHDRAVAQLTLPDGLAGGLRRKLKGVGYEGFKQLILEFLHTVAPVLKSDPAATPLVTVVQRHYPSQRSVPICDARLEFDPRTAIAARGAVVKFQEEWLQAAFSAFDTKRANIQVAVGVQFPFARSTAVRDSDFVDRVEQTFLACAPFLGVMGLVG